MQVWAFRKEITCHFTRRIYLMKSKIKMVILMSIRGWEHPIIFEAFADTDICGMLRVAGSCLRNYFEVGINLKWSIKCRESVLNFLARSIFFLHHFSLEGANWDDRVIVDGSYSTIKLHPRARKIKTHNPRNYEWVGLTLFEHLPCARLCAECFMSIFSSDPGSHP